MLIEQTLASGEKIKLLSSGKLFFQHLENLINEAAEEIHFQVYIFENDETGLETVVGGATRNASHTAIQKIA